MLFFLVLLAIIAPIVVVAPLQDDVVLPKLATTAAFTGAALLWGALMLARDRWPAGRWPATLWIRISRSRFWMCTRMGGLLIWARGVWVFREHVIETGLKRKNCSHPTNRKNSRLNF